MDKVLDEIIEINGFYITAHGDPSAGILDAEWELSNKFYFDNQKEFDEFKESLYQLFENYCGEITIETFDERLTQISKEEKEHYQQFPKRYLIKSRDYNDSYKQAGSTASYSSSIGDAIHVDLPHWMSEGNYGDIIIDSDNPEFRKILLKAAGQLERDINNDEYRLSNAKRNLAAIKLELKYGK